MEAEDNGWGGTRTAPLLTERRVKSPTEFEESVWVSTRKARAVPGRALHRSRSHGFASPPLALANADGHKVWGVPAAPSLARTGVAAPAAHGHWRMPPANTLKSDL